MTDYPQREDADYRIVERSNTYSLTDKRTGHRHQFTHVVVNGFKDNVFLRHLSPMERKKDVLPTTGNRVGILDKESLPRWLIDEFKHIDNHDSLTPQTDPREVSDGS